MQLPKSGKPIALKRHLEHQMLAIACNRFFLRHPPFQYAKKSGKNWPPRIDKAAVARYSIPYERFHTASQNGRID